MKKNLLLTLVSVLLLSFSCEKESSIMPDQPSIDLENENAQIENRGLSEICCPRCRISGTYTADEPGTFTIFGEDDCDDGVTFTVQSTTSPLSFSVHYRAKADGDIRAVYNADNGGTSVALNLTYSFSCGTNYSGTQVQFLNQAGVTWPNLDDDLSKKIGEYTYCTPDSSDPPEG